MELVAAERRGITLSGIEAACRPGIRAIGFAEEGGRVLVLNQGRLVDDISPEDLAQ